MRSNCFELEPFRRHSRAFLLVTGLLAGCGGGGDGAVPPTGVDVDTPAFDHYETDHNKFNRVLLMRTGPGDQTILDGIDGKGPPAPADYRELIALNDALYDGKMTVEVIGQVDATSGAATRLLRLTVDQAPFENVKDGALVESTGKFYLRGQNFAWVTIDGGPLLSGSQADGGLVNLELDFDREVASINLVTRAAGDSVVRTEATGTDLPFNIVTGAYGGDITVQIWDPNSSVIHDIAGSLRGNVGGSHAYSDNKHGMTTSGLYTATGTSNGVPVTIDGAYFGTDPNALP